MAKVRLHLGIISDYGLEETIICKKINTIIIDGKIYYKKDCKNDSMKIQNFYRKIIKNSDKIEYIKYGNNSFNYAEMFLKNGKLHNLNGFAKVWYNENISTVGYYYIDGLKLEKKDFLIHPKRKIWLREHKLERILKNVNI